MRQMHRILEASSVSGLLNLQDGFLSANGGYQVAFKRYFLSNPQQANELPKEQGAVSVICQPPLSGAAIGVWLWLVDCADVVRLPDATLVRDGNAKFLWTSVMLCFAFGPERQMSQIFVRYENSLASNGMSLERNCVRTWIFVDDIDNNYAGVVKGRREHFERAGLTPQTHYIASTGIQGRPCSEGSVVMMDALAVSAPDLRQTYLYAPAHMNPTYEYGVTFERGVQIECAGTRATFISGTASIDSKGNVVHVGDVRAQTLRMWENVGALLAEAGNSWDDVKQILVYLRNASDYPVVAPMFARKFPRTPYIILAAPVCRPTWLIEMECIA